MEHIKNPKGSYPLAIPAAEASANSPCSPISMHNIILPGHLCPSNDQLVANFNQVGQTKDLKDIKLYKDKFYEDIHKIFMKDQFQFISEHLCVLPQKHLTWARSQSLNQGTNTRHN